MVLLGSMLVLFREKFFLLDVSFIDLDGSQEMYERCPVKSFSFFGVKENTILSDVSCNLPHGRLP